LPPAGQPLRGRGHCQSRRTTDGPRAEGRRSRIGRCPRWCAVTRPQRKPLIKAHGKLDGSRVMLTLDTPSEGELAALDRA